MAFGIPSFREIIRRSKETASRFPLALLASFVVTFISIYLVETEPHKLEGKDLVLARIALSASLAVFVFTAIRLWTEQLPRIRQRIWMFLGMAGIVAYFFLLPDNSEDFGATIVSFRHIFLSVLFLVGFLWAPFARTSIDNRDYWEYAKHIFFAMVMTFLFTIIVIVGINGALFAVEKLFDIAIKGKRYFEVDIFIVGVFSVGYFLSQIPVDPLASRFATEPPRVERFFTKWLLTGLSGLYFVILYAYTAKVLFTMNWPKGILAWLIVIFSTVAILTYLFWTHFSDAERGGWRRWIWLAVLLQTGMLFVAIGMRIAEYSWTESRYMIFVLGVWLTGISLYFLLIKRAQLKWIFVSLSVLIAVTQFGPWSAYDVSKNAQMQRLRHHLEALKSYPRAEKAPIKLRYEISDGIDYLHRRYKGEALRNIFPEEVAAFRKLEAEREARKKRGEKGMAVAADAPGTPRYLPHYLTDKLGFAFVDRWKYRNVVNNKGKAVEFSTRSLFSSSSRSMLEVKGYDYIGRIEQYGYNIIDRNGTLKGYTGHFTVPPLSFVYTPAFELIVRIGEDQVGFDLARLLSELQSRYAPEKGNVDPEAMVLKGRQGKLMAKLQLTTLGKHTFQKHEIVYFSGILFVKEAP